MNGVCDGQSIHAIKALPTLCFNGVYVRHDVNVPRGETESVVKLVSQSLS